MGANGEVTDKSLMVVDLLGDAVQLRPDVNPAAGSTRLALWRARQQLLKEGADPLACQWYLVCEALGRGDTDAAAERNAALLPYFYPRISGQVPASGGLRGSVTFEWDTSAAEGQG